MDMSNDAVFDKPIVSPSDFDELAHKFLLRPIAARSRFLGGVPNVTIAVGSDEQQLAVRICNNGYTSVRHLELELSALDYLAREGFNLVPRLVVGVDERLL